MKGYAHQPSKSVSPKLILIPPLHEDFNVYGGEDTVKRARRWALERKYMLVHGVPACAHGLYLMASCPLRAGVGSTCQIKALDHVNLWMPYELGPGNNVFLLSAPYMNDIDDELVAYANAHGLEVNSGDHLSDADGWYSGGSALPIRLTIPNDWPIWPIETEAVVVLHTQPLWWPETQQEVEDALEAWNDGSFKDFDPKEVS